MIASAAVLFPISCSSDALQLYVRAFSSMLKDKQSL